MLVIDLPFLPVSVNACYRASGKRVYKSKRLREFDKKMEAVLNGLDKIDGPVSLDVEFELKSKRKRDIDNLLKSLIDGLENRVIGDDSNIIKLSAIKYFGKVNRTKIIIKKYPDQLDLVPPVSRHQSPCQNEIQ